MSERPEAGAVRLDKWLWAARFFKTRSLAATAVTGGKIHLEGQRSKPGREVRPGARIKIRKGDEAWEVVVRATSRQRGPAPLAQLLYEETESSRERRDAQRERRRQEAQARPVPGERPTKRDRRRLQRLTGADNP